MSIKSINLNNSSLQDILPAQDRDLYEAAWATARRHFGGKFTFYLPGMIRYGRERGRYPAISITGNRCELLCEHCKGKLLDPMLKAENPARLLEISLRLKSHGAHGILLSGGSDRKGKLPWKDYENALKKIKRKTGLFMSAHIGFTGYQSCKILKEAGVTQALIDIMGDENTARLVYHLEGLKEVLNTLKAIKKSGIQLIPHIVAGLLYGKINAEYKALEIIRRYHPNSLVIVVLTPLKGTPMATITSPSPLEIGRLIAKARLLMPDVPISLGCERPRDRNGWIMERLAIRAGVNRMAIWSEQAVQEAKNLGLFPRFQATCCSLSYRPEFIADVKEET